MKDYLFLFTIGPVQSFISQARKTQDLYAGSKLLSDLCRKGLENVRDRYKASIIFPDIANKSLPNRFLAKVTLDSAESARKLGNKIEVLVEHEFISIAKNIFRKVSGKPELDPRFIKQIKSHLEIYWVFEEIEGDYKQSFQNIEQNLGAIKNARIFEQLEEAGRKCSVSGISNALFFNAHEQVPAFVTDPIRIHEVTLNKHEGLSSISFIKRFYEKEAFPPTAKIAALDVLEGLEDGDLKKYTDLYKGQFDEQLLYEENLNINYFQKQGLLSLLGGYQKIVEGLGNKQLRVNDAALDFLIENLGNSLKPFREQLKILKQSTHDQKFKSYYAIIRFDADNMGAWLSGKGKGIPEEDLERYHKDLSEILGSFARWATGYVDMSKGKTVYAGGDDFLGFVNLHYLLEVIQELRFQFEVKVNKRLKGKYPSIPAHENMSFSAGVNIAHYKEPLGEALNWSIKMEEKAKNVSAKDAIAISVQKASGEIQQTVLKFQDRSLAHLSSILEALKDDLFSTSFLHRLEDEFNIYQNSEKTDQRNRLVKAEITRLLVRSANTKQAKEKVKDVSFACYELFKETSVREGGVSNFFGLLSIIDFLKRKAKI